MNILNIWFDNCKFCLIGKIKGLSLESRKIRSRIDKSKKIEYKVRLITLKNDIGKYSRHHLLAYAFLRGKLYISVEKKCQVKPNPELIFEIVHSSIHSFQKRIFTIDTINSWLKGEKSVVD